MSPSSERDLIESIPDPDRVRRRLSEVLSEAALLRALLRLSQRKRQADSREGERQEAANA